MQGMYQSRIKPLQTLLEYMHIAKQKHSNSQLTLIGDHNNATNNLKIRVKGRTIFQNI